MAAINKATQLQMLKNLDMSTENSKTEQPCTLHGGVCCALCNDELTEIEINTNLQMGALESDAICERCWQQRNQENYEQYEP